MWGPAATARLQCRGLQPTMRWEDVDNDVDGGEWGNHGNIIISESEKNKGKESQTLPTEKKMGEKINQIIQTMNQQGEKTIIITTIVRVD